MVIIKHPDKHSWGTKVLGWVTVCLINMAMVLSLVLVSIDNKTAHDALTREIKTSRCLSEAYDRLARLVVQSSGTLYDIVVVLSEPSPDRDKLTDLTNVLRTNTRALDSEINGHDLALAACISG